MNITKIFLDMDGVIVDFNGGVKKKFGVKELSNPYAWDYDFVKDFGCSQKDFWESLKPNFWRDLNFTQEAGGIFSIFKRKGILKNVCILSSPPNEDGFKGKAQWIRNKLPQLYYNKQFLLGNNKNWCANKKALLIDDNPKNCLSFYLAGGNTFLFPRPWNTEREFEGRAILLLEEYLDGIKIGELL